MQGQYRDELAGTTLKVYRDILRAQSPVRISDVQRDVGLSSPSLAQYHIRKLLEMGLIREEGNGYVVEKVVIENIFRVRNWLIPFQSAYVVFFTLTLCGMIASLELAAHPIISSFDFIALSANVAAVAVSIYEMRRTMKNIS